MGGQAVTFQIILGASQGSFDHSGQDAAFQIKQVSDAGSFTLSGQSVAFTIATIMQAGTGMFTLSGQDISVTLGLVLDYGSFTLTGQDVTLTLSDLEPAFEVDSELATIKMIDLGLHLLQDDHSWSVATSAVDQLNLNQSDVSWRIKNASRRWNIRKDD